MHHPNRSETPELEETAKEKDIFEHPDHGIKYAATIIIALCAFGIVLSTVVVVIYFKFFAT